MPDRISYNSYFFKLQICKFLFLEKKWEQERGEKVEEEQKEKERVKEQNKTRRRKCQKDQVVAKTTNKIKNKGRKTVSEKIKEEPHLQEDKNVGGKKKRYTQQEEVKWTKGKKGTEQDKVFQARKIEESPKKGKPKENKEDN